MADKDKSKISDEQLKSIGMSRAKWEELTSYYSKLMDKALDKPETGLLKPANFMKIYNPNTELVDDFSSFVSRLSSDPQIKNLFVGDVDKKFTPLGNDPKMGLRETFKKNYTGGAEDEVMNKFSFAEDTVFGESDDEKKITAQGGDVNAPRYQGFNPETKEETKAGSFMDQITGLNKKLQDKFGKPNPQKVRALQAAKNMYGYEGGAAQARKDQALLKSTRLGMREADGSFRLRTADEIAARNREGRASINQPNRDVMKNFRDRYGDGVGGSRLEQEMKQFQKDTGVKDPLKLESDTRANEQMRAFEQTARDRQKTLDKYRVKEPPKFGDEVAALNEKDQARVMALVNKREEEMKKKPVR